MTADSTLAPLNQIFIRALKRMGEAGDTDAACRLAAEAWSPLRHDWSREAQRLNGVMHALTKQPPVDKKERRWCQTNANRSPQGQAC